MSNKSVILSSQRLYFRDENDNYFSTDVLSDKTSKELEDDIKAIGEIVKEDVSATYSNFKRDIVLVQPNQPTTNNNRIWVDSDDYEDVVLTTGAEFESLKTEVGYLQPKASDVYKIPRATSAKHVEWVNINQLIQTGPSGSVTITNPNTPVSVTNGSVTEDKMDPTFLKQIQNFYVTPEMFGAVGDGANDDGPALKAALESGKPVILTKDLWIKSDVIVSDKDIVFNGCNKTIHCIKAGITIRAQATSPVPYEVGNPAMDNINGCSRVTKTYQTEEEQDRGPYFRGYLTYRGRKSIEETYDQANVIFWDIHSVIFENVLLDCTNMDSGGGHGKAALQVWQMCNSRISNVHTWLKDGDLGAAGILIAHGQRITVTGCSSRGWVLNSPELQRNDVRGYGIQVFGDSITVSDCKCEQNKHCIIVGSPENCWSSNIAITNCTVRDLYTRPDDITNPTHAGETMQLIDVHGDAVNVSISNCTLYWWTTDGSIYSSPVIAIRNPYTTISNCCIYTEGGWIHFGENAKIVRIEGLYAPNVIIVPDLKQGGDYNDKHFLSELHLTNCEFSRLTNRGQSTKVFLYGCTVREVVQGVRYLIARNCLFPRDISWASEPTITLIGESIFSDCIIYGHTESGIPKKSYAIVAPENEIHMDNCKIYTHPNEKIFDTEQRYLTNVWTESVFATYLDIQSIFGTNTLI